MDSTPSSASEPISSQGTPPSQAVGRKPELLAPAGGPAALRAAVNNGADAVYLGVEQLNARRVAENFSLESLGDATHYAHVRGVRVYLTANVMILAHEMSEALDMIDRAWVA
ncbi:MAG: peptidase U32 family protein, partial [Coriobacteriia bacterium]